MREGVDSRSVTDQPPTYRALTDEPHSALELETRLRGLERGLQNVCVDLEALWSSVRTSPPSDASGYGPWEYGGAYSSGHDTRTVQDDGPEWEPFAVTVVPPGVKGATAPYIVWMRRRWS